MYILCKWCNSSIIKFKSVEIKGRGNQYEGVIYKEVSNK